MFYPELNLNRLFQEWYGENSENEEIIGMNVDQRKEHFKNYVRNKIAAIDFERESEKIENYINENHNIFQTLTLGGKRKAKTKSKKQKSLF